MNKTELVNALASKLKRKKVDIEEVINAFLEVSKDCVCSGEDLTLMGFGTFEAYQRKPRKGRHPITKKEILVPGSWRVRFKVGKEFQKALQKKA